MLHRGVLYLLTAALALMASPALTPPVAAQTTYVVDDDPTSCMGGPPDAPTIGHASLLATNGDTIIVCEGNYTESGLGIDKSVTITGPGATPADDGVATVHHGGAATTMFVISADGVTLEGLDLDATPPSGFGGVTSGIYVTASYVTIQDNEIRNATDWAVSAGSPSNSNVNILRNYVHDNGEGIVCSCDDSGLWSNTVDGGGGTALSLTGDRGTIAGNVVTNGVVQAIGNDLLVDNNQISAGPTTSTLYVSGSPVTVTNNALSDSGYYGIEVSADTLYGTSSTSVTIGRNTFTQINTPIYLSDQNPSDAFAVTATIGGSPSEANTFVNSGGALGDSNYLVEMKGPTANVNAEHNDWGLCTAADIEQEIHHQVDDPTQGLVDFEPFIAPGSCSAPTATPTSTTTATPMPPATGQMHYCPEAGKWSIATWSGPNATPIETTLASCTNQVDAAYRIDPDTQAWTRYFRGRPEITNLATIDNGQGVIALGAGMSAASAAGDEPLRAAANGMLGCPQSGKWAISVWPGADGTDTGQALAACGADAVAAAYYLDPQTQGWLRWFAGRPDISNLVALNTMQGVIALGTGGPPPSTATTTPIAEAGGLDGFRAFAQLIEAALDGGDAQFFVQRARLTELTCTGEEFPLPCAGQPAGTTLSGISSRAWQSDASSLLSPEEYAQWLEDYFSTALSDLSDEYGSGSLTLYALAHGEAEGNEIFRAITTSIVDRYPSGTPIGHTEREAHIFDFEFQDGRWQFTGEIVALTSVTSPDWLSGECGSCYDHWERWTGATQ